MSEAKSQHGSISYFVKASTLSVDALQSWFWIYRYINATARARAKLTSQLKNNKRRVYILDYDSNGLIAGR